MQDWIISSIKHLGFKPKDGSNCVYIKLYNNYSIEIDYNETAPKKSAIDYGSKIICHRKTTCNFSQNETLVVLECVNRLLEKGYKPENIELEKSWSMGHTEGYLDIWVKDENNDSFLMIECKTWGKEFDKYIKETYTHKNKTKENDGGQIFSYLQQETRTTKAVCYYTSQINNNKTEYKNAIIENKKEWADLNQVERFNRWSKNFETNGIFDDNVPLYNIESKAIRRKDLKELKREDSVGIYNQFAEILRHNVVSDKPNAFNKMINLFLCKIWDEDTEDNEKEMKFQTRTNNRNKTNEELLEDLNDLYKLGMESYLDKDISDYSKNDFDVLLNSVDDSNKKEEFEELYKTLRLYKNNEFAFKEVFDKKSFDDNAKVVREVVELLQDKQLRYSHKQQFLGDFFEKLLNDSIKQEAGQFFTPVPLTQFIIKSLPIKKIIENKIKDNDLNPLPYVIDYACGTGHFLTEIMDYIDKIIKNDIDINSIQKRTVKEDFKIWKSTQFKWAKEYIYGIDLDYRLIKASKISCFLNGDGEANLIHANGLAPFNSDDYIKKLHSEDNKQNNQQFDLLIANPPYSVKTFKPTIKYGDKSFKLFNHLTENSSEIECLFIERAKQLLKEGGYAGIVLPVSLLTNNGIYTKAREIILKYFDIKGILSLQDNAFMATGTKTIILLMQRRPNSYWEQTNQFVENFFKNYTDTTVNGIEKAFLKFVENTYEDLTFEDYISILKNAPTENAKKSEIFKDYKNTTNDIIREIEKDKILYFLLSYNSKIILANSGEKTLEKEFLGYEFSNRRGQEGINIKKDEENNIISSLFSDTNLLDDNKLNYYMFNNLLENNIDSKIDTIMTNKTHPLNSHIDYCRLSDLIDFSLTKSEKFINLNAKKKIKFQSKYNIVKIKYIHDLIVQKGANITEKEAITGNIPVVAGGVLPAYYHNKSNREANTITISASGNAGYTNFYTTPIWASDCITINSSDEDKIKIKYVYEILKSQQQKIYYLQTGKNQGHVYPEDINNIKIPLAPFEVQEKIVNNSKRYDLIYENNKKLIQEKRKLIQDKYEKLYKNTSSTIRLSDSNTFQLTIGKRILQKELSNNKNATIVYSANVFEPFGYIDKKLLTDFDKPSVLWGIDGDWMVNLIEKNKTFYPTDHCGVLRLVNNNILLEEYVAFALNKVGIEYGFSRAKRASIDRIKELKIPIPDIKEQKNIVEQIIPIEHEIQKLQEEIDKIPEQKQAILNKLLH